MTRGESQPPGQRRRNAVLEVLELFADHAPNARPGTLSGFLYICENEGLCISELAVAGGLNMAAASRTAAALVVATPGRPALVVTRMRGRVRSLCLTDAGRDLRDRIDAIVREGVTISSAPDAA